VLPADVAAVVVRMVRWSPAAAAALEAAEALAVDRDGSRPLDDERATHRTLDREELSQPRGPNAPEHRVCGRGRQAEVRAEPVRTPAQLDSQAEERGTILIARPARRAVWPRAAIGERIDPMAPAVRGPSTDADLSCGAGHADPGRFGHEVRAGPRCEPTGAVQRSPSD
jgi:hypothetical protein